jgi:hypothetical protein
MKNFWSYRHFAGLKRQKMFLKCKLESDTGNVQNFKVEENNKKYKSSIIKISSRILEKIGNGVLRIIRGLGQEKYKNVSHKVDY